MCWEREFRKVLINLFFRVIFKGVVNGIINVIIDFLEIFRNFYLRYMFISLGFFCFLFLKVKIYEFGLW